MTKMASLQAQDKKKVDNILIKNLDQQALLYVLLKSKHLLMIILNQYSLYYSPFNLI
jgi:hypothetical protein